MIDKTDSKKKFRILGVPRPKNIRNYAAQIEATMNELTGAGYDVQLSDEKNGVLIIGRLSEPPAQSPLLALLGGVPGMSRHAPASKLSPRTLELLQRFRHIPVEDTEVLRAEARKQASSLVRGFTAEEIATAADEATKEADEHEKTHDADSTCIIPAGLRTLAEVLKEAAALQLQ